MPANTLIVASADTGRPFAEPLQNDYSTTGAKTIMPFGPMGPQHETRGVLALFRPVNPSAVR
jgi:hypothetical protein